MFTVLIADDQDVVRNGIRKMLADLLPGDISDIYEASDGEEAVALVKTRNPDVILIDIVMPKLDGLQAIERLRKEGVGAFVVILSAHADFGYAKRAISTGVSEYMLKPVSQQELFAALMKYKASVSGDHVQLRGAADLRRSLYDCLRDQPTNRSVDPSERSPSLLQQLGMPNTAQTGLCVFVLKLNMLEAERIVAVKNGLDAQVAKLRLPFVSLDDGNNELIFVIHPENCGAESVEDQLRKLMNASVIPMNGGLSDISNGGVEELKRLYKQACAALRQSVFQNVKLCTHAQTRNTSGSLIGQHIYTLLLDCLRGGRKAEFDAHLHDLFVRLSKHIFNIEETENELVRLAGYLIYNAFGNGDSMPPVRDVEEKLRTSRNFYELKRAAEDALQRIYDGYQERHAASGTNYIVNYIVNYANQSYSKETSLTRIANELSMNYSYISNLFTQKTGTTFTAYLMRLRLQKAVEMIHQGNTRIKDISSKCGFKSQRYFCKAFKEHYKKTPSEYIGKS